MCSVSALKFPLSERHSYLGLASPCRPLSLASLSASFCCHSLHLQLFFSTLTKMLWYSAFSDVAVIFSFTFTLLQVSYVLLCIEAVSAEPQAWLQLACDDQDCHCMHCDSMPLWPSLTLLWVMLCNNLYFSTHFLFYIRSASASLCLFLILILL